MSITEIDVTLKNFKYPIYIGQHFLEKSLLIKHIHGRQVLIVTQHNVAKLYLTFLKNVLSDYQVDIFFLPDGDENKNFQQWQNILNYLIEKKHERSTTLIAFGGGVVGDITGFAAACYQRGVNYLQIPTTLIAQVDSAIGGKTAINHTAGKNLIGAFYQPRCVISDIQFLSSLPEREFQAGLGEIIKYGLIYDANFFYWLEENISQLYLKNTDALFHTITRSAAIKAEIVGKDEKDVELRNILNFGHTFGHALELLGSYQNLLHGEAVMLGMVLAVRVSKELELLSSFESNRIINFLKSFPFVKQYQLPCFEDLVEAMKLDKKTQDGKLNLILLKRIGKAVKFSLDPVQIHQAYFL